jgi:hypothetical protein
MKGYYGQDVVIRSTKHYLVKIVYFSEMYNYISFRDRILVTLISILSHIARPPCRFIDFRKLKKDPLDICYNNVTVILSFMETGQLVQKSKLGYTHTGRARSHQPTFFP